MLNIFLLVCIDKMFVLLVGEFLHLGFWDGHLELVVDDCLVLLVCVLKLLAAADHTLIPILFVKLLHLMHLIFLGQQNVCAFVVDAHV